MCRCLLRSTVVSLLVLLAAVPAAHALTREPGAPTPENEKVTLGPPRTVYTVDPGSRYVLPLLVRNHSTSAFVLYISPVDLEASTSPRSLAQPAAGPPKGAATWITPEVRKVRIAPGESITFRATIEVPENAEPGLHPAAVLVRRRIYEDAASTDGRGRVTVDASIGAQVLLTVRGTATTDVQLRALHTPRLVRAGSRPTFTTDVHNTGQTLLTVDGKLALGTFVGTDAGTIALREVLVLPDGHRRVSARWNDPPFIGWFHPRMFLTINGVQHTVNFPTVYVLPPWWVLALLIGAIALPIVVRRRAKRGRGDN